MSVEASSGGAPESELAAGVFHEDGSLNEAFVSERYGIGAEEALQEVQFGSHQGTVAQMLADEACPVGDRMQEAYQEKGLDGVEEVLKGFAMADPRFSVVVSEATRKREQDNKAPEKPPEDPPTGPPAVSRVVEHEQPVEAVESVRRQATAMQQELVREPEPLERAAPEATAELHPVIVETAEAVVVQEKADIEVESAAPIVAKPPVLVEATPMPDVEAQQPDDTIQHAVATVMTVPQPELSEPLPPVPSPTRPSPRDTVSRTVLTPQPEAAVTVTESASVEIAATSAAPLGQEPSERDSGVSEVPVAEAEPEEKEELIEPVSELEAVPTVETEEFAYKLAEQAPDTADEFMTQIVEALQSPEAAINEPVQAAVTEVVALSQQLHELQAAGADGTDVEQLLEAACVRLLESLDIPYTEETIEKLTAIILAAYEPLGDKLPDTSQAAGVLSRQGTHEHKLPEFTMPSFIMRAGRNLLSFQRLGRWAVSRA